VSRTTTAVTVGLREQLRNYVLLALLVVLPIAFISVAFAVTQDTTMPVRTIVDGQTTTVPRPMPDVHGVIMTPITSTIIAGLVGLFLMQNAAVDQRLGLSGYRAREVIAARFGVLLVLTLVVTAVSVGVMVVDFVPENPVVFVAAMLLLSAIYGLVGMLVGALLDRLAGLWVMLILPMLDVGLFQDPLFVRDAPAWWMKLFPGYHPTRVLVDAGLTGEVDTLASMGWGLAYLLVVGTATIGIYYRTTRIAGRGGRP